MSSKKKNQSNACGKKERVSQYEKSPPLYRVVLVNDDCTPMDFVVSVLKQYFSMEPKIATAVMLQAHKKGKTYCGFYVREIAETKMAQLNECAKRNHYPLLCKIEPFE